MIYDFGCTHDVPFFRQLLLSLAGASAVLLAVAGLSALGAVLQRRVGFRSTDLFAGWGFAAAVMTLAVVVLPHALPWVAAWIGFLMVGSVWHVFARGYFYSPFWLLMAFPGLVVLTALGVLGVSGWDDFSRWVPNGLYLFHYDAVPSMAMPAAHSAWPGYPYALPMFTYLASHIAGGFLVQGGAMFNFVLLLSFAGMLAECGLFEREAPKPHVALMRLGLALLAVTLANPSFDAGFTMTNQGDTSLMILTAALAVLLWRTLELLQRQDRAQIHDVAMQVAFLALAFVLIKPAGVVLLVLLAGAFIVVAYKNGVIKGAARWLPLMFVPAVGLHLIWQYYVAVEMNGPGLGVQPLGAWRFDLVPEILGAMFQEVLRKNGLFAFVLFLTMGAIVCLFKPATKLRNFIVMAGLVCGGYIAFLFICYLGANFSEVEARRAVAFYRYSTHVGLLGVVFVWLAVPVVVGIFKDKIKIPTFFPTLKTAGVVFLMCLLPLSLLFHRGWLIRGADAQICAYRALGDRLAEVVPDGTYMAVLDMGSGGFLGYVIGLQMALHEVVTGHSSYVVASVGASEATVAADQERYSEMENVSAVFIHQKDDADDKDVLLLSDDEGWMPMAF